jgi:hypothetical protein
LTEDEKQQAIADALRKRQATKATGKQLDTSAAAQEAAKRKKKQKKQGNFGM